MFAVPPPRRLGSNGLPSSAPAAPPSRGEGAMMLATANFGAAMGWGAASAVSVPFVALIPPLWLVPAYCGARSVASLGCSVYNAGRAALPWLPNSDPLTKPRLLRALRDAEALRENGQWAEAAHVLAPHLSEPGHFGAELFQHPQARLLLRCTHLYNASIRAHIEQLPNVRPHQTRLAQALHAADDDAFTEFFASLAPHERRTAVYMSAGAAAQEQLIELAIMHDCPLALGALFDNLQASEPTYEPWLRPLYLQVHRDALFRRVCEDHLPRIGQRMVAHGYMAASHYLATFAAYADGDHPVVYEAARSFVDDELIAPLRCLELFPDRGLMRHLLHTEQISIVEVATMLGGNLRATLFDTLCATSAGAKKLCESRILSKNEALTLVRNGKLTPRQAARHCPVGEPAAHAWYTEGHISLEDYVPFTTANYTPNLPLTDMQVAFAAGFHQSESLSPAAMQCLQPLWESMRQASVRGGIRRSLILRLSTIALTSPRPQEASQVTDASKPTACMVCFEPFTKRRTGIRTAHCNHPPSVCSSCVAEQAASNQSMGCMVPNCASTLSPNDLLAARVPPKIIDTLCANVVRARLAAVPNWRTCWTPECIGGAQVPKGTQQTFCCPICTRTSTLASRALDSQKDIEYARRLIDHLGNLASMNDAMRECYWCGTGTEHGDACAHMNCTTCKLDWDFNRGLMNGSNAGHRFTLAQAYVPRAGLLLDAGLYEGLEPGSLNHIGETVRNHVRKRATELGLL